MLIHRARCGACVLLFALLLLLAGCGGKEAAAPRAVGGQIDLRSWDFERDGIVALDGEWRMVWDEFADPRTPAPPGARAIAVPAPWNEVAGQPHGRATYELTVQCERGAGLALSLPVQHSAVRWFVNGALLARQGEPGASARGAQPAALQQTVALGSIACPLHLVAHVSNFEMRLGGLLRAVELGEVSQLANRRELALMRDLMSVGGLLVLGVMPLVFFAGRPKDRAPLWFGLLCLVFALGMSMTGTRILQPLLAPLGWTRYLQLVFVCWYAQNALFALFARSMYPQHVAVGAIRVIVAWVGLSAAAVVVTTPALFTQLIPMLTAGSILMSLYIGWRLLAAYRDGRRTALLLLLSFAALAVAVAHDVVAFAHLTRLTLLPYGVLLFVAAPAYLMARRFSRAMLLEERMAVEQRERANLLVRSTRAGLLDWDAISGRTIYSDRFREMLGYSSGPDAPELPPFRDQVHPDDRDRIHGSFVAQLRDRSVVRGVRPGEAADYRLRRADGAYLWVHAEAIAVCGTDGRTLRYICSFIDITDTKRYEEAMREQQAALRAQVELTRTEQRRLDLVVRGARVGIVDWDGVTHETYYSPIFREIRGYAPDADTSGWPDYFRVMIHPDDRERITRRWITFIKGRGPEGPRGEYYAPEEYRLSRADGSHGWVQVSGIAVRDDEGFVTRWIAAVVDISERRAQDEALRASSDQIAQQARQLERQNEALKENVRLREEVERIGRHDIKTPLNSIVSVPRLLREERRLGPEADELLGIVERAGYRILSMVNLSLDLYKMEQGSYIFRPDAVDLQDLVDKVLADVRMHAASKGVHFDVDLAGAPYAWAEELLCYSLLANLIKNAVEASPEGQAVRIRAEAGADQTVLLHVHNRGAVPPAIRGSFFQKYATLGKASGTGLGTYSARLMARVQDGDIAMQTSDDAGTTLSVTLRAAASGVIPASVRHASERRSSEPVQLASLPGRRVLLVDDDEYNLLIVRRFLPVPPFTVDTAINGRMALAAAEREWPDVIFMDLDMPVMGGMQAVRELRAMERAQGRKRCTMIALSSHEDEDTQQAALAAGFDRYLTKPVTREVLHRTLLELAGGPAAPPAPRPVVPAPSPADPVEVDADMEPMLHEYLLSRRELISGLAGTLQAGGREELRRLAHQLAGSFGLYGFRWASEQCRWIERNFDNVDAQQLEAVGGRLHAHLEAADIRFVTLD
jgi:PAS domain S-box-containing protein